MTAACNECRTLLGGYVLHALEPDEAETVRRHLSECAACATEHGELMGVPSILDSAGADETPVEQPPAALEEAVLDRFAREHPGHPAVAPPPKRTRTRDRLRAAFRPLARPLPAAIAGAVAAAAVTAALIVLPGGSQDSELYQASLSGSAAAPGATASARLRVLEEGTRVNLRVRGLHGGPGSVYELWCIRDDGQKVSAGTFRTDASGRADVNLTTAAVPGEYNKLGVERKPGVTVMAGSIRFPHS
jgi:Anti-sigma-K factor rskA/Putative zinc-finger